MACDILRFLGGFKKVEEFHRLREKVDSKLTIARDGVIESGKEISGGLVD